MTNDSKQTTAHTPESWEHGDNGLIYGQCGKDDVEAPIICDVIEDCAMRALGMLSPVEEANARRICAAVNACKGIGTEALENGVVKELLASSIKFSEALRNNYSDAQLCLEERDAWRDAIAKATGGAV